MIDITTKTYAIREILSSNVDCEFTSVVVTVDKEKIFEEVKSLFPAYKFTDEIDDDFEEIGDVSASGQLNLYYDPEYYLTLKLFYNKLQDIYALKLKQ